PYHLVDRADLGAAGHLPGLVEGADRDALVVDVEADVEHGCLLKSLYLGNAATGFQVTGPTGASFIVSTPRSDRPGASFGCAGGTPVRRLAPMATALPGRDRLASVSSSPL